jgi:hypothetical protein
MQSDNKFSTMTAESQTLGLCELPVEIIQAKARYLSEVHRQNLGSVSRGMHSLFQPKLLLDKFLQGVAYGMQDKVEQLFTDIYASDAAKIQEALRYRGGFADYSGRTFNCSAYEYAYWAKDTHMCRMLERYMDDDTKAQMLTRIDAIEVHGLTFQQNDETYHSAHFDFTPLKKAYQHFLAGYNEWYASKDWDAMFGAWLDVGKAQRNVPAHVAQEYYRPDRSFNPRPEFNEATFPRLLTFYNWTTGKEDSWFPLTANSGLGFDHSFGFVRTAMFDHGLISGCGYADDTLHNLAAITRLDEVRTVDLAQSREYLKQPVTRRAGI